MSERDADRRNITDSIVAFQDQLDEWRKLGSRTLPNGVELIGNVGEDAWLHAVYPTLLDDELGDLEDDLGKPLPGSYRSFLKGCGGLVCFGGLFTLHPYRSIGPLDSSLATVAEGVLRLNQLLSGARWLPDGAIAFASNALDGSVQMFGMGERPAEVVRCDPQSGEIIERHPHIFACVGDRLNRCDHRFFPEARDGSLASSAAPKQLHS